MSKPKKRKCKVSTLAEAETAVDTFVEDPDPLQTLAGEINVIGQAIADGDQQIASVNADNLSKAFEAGKLLRQAKERAGHGKWGDWVEANINFSHRTADDYMSLAKYETLWQESDSQNSANSIAEALKRINANKPVKPRKVKPKPDPIERDDDAPGGDDRYGDGDGGDDDDDDDTPVQPEPGQFHSVRPKVDPAKAARELRFALSHWLPQLKEVEAIEEVRAYFDQVAERCITAINTDKAMALFKGAVVETPELKTAVN